MKALGNGAPVFAQYSLLRLVIHSNHSIRSFRARHKPITPAKKKNGVDRGLLEEETSTAKKTANMAADDCIIYLHDKRARIAKPLRNQVAIGGYSDRNRFDTHVKYQA